MSEAPASEERQGGSRLRAVLVVIIVLLLLGMVVLGFFFVRMLRPVGTPKQQAVDGQELEWVRSIYGFGPAKDEQLFEPTSVAIAPNGDIYATDPQRARIMRFTSSGAFKSLLHTGRGGLGKGQFLRPSGIAVDADSNVYIADSNANKIIVFNDAGDFVREWGSDRPLGVYVTDELVYALTNGAVSVYGLDGEARGSFGTRGRNRGQIDAFQGVVSDGERIYVADALNHRVVAFDQKGGVVWMSPDAAAPATTSAEATNTAEAPSSEPFELPQDIVFDGAGRLVVIDAFKFKLIVLSPEDGTVLGSYGDYGGADGTFFYPTGIDYDPQRDWFAVADTRNDRVQIVRIPGSGESAQAAARRLLTSPYRYCAPPILLALIALVVALVTRRRATAAEDDEDESDGAAHA